MRTARRRRHRASLGMRSALVLGHDPPGSVRRIGRTMSSWPPLVRRPDETASARRRRPVQYLITIYNTAETVRALDAPGQHEFNDMHEALQRELRAAGELVETNVFSDIEARVVRVEGGEPVVAEGRFMSGAIWAG